jgi:multidrug efflux pump subunit AcrA (membrane-fusion protein)
MSESKPPLDLAALARPEIRATVHAPKRRRLGLWVVLALLLGFGAVLASSLTDLLRGTRDVTVVRPRLVDASATTAGLAGSSVPLLQAAGWVEPDPFAIQASARVPGVVERVYVQESAHVKQGDLLAKLHDDVYRIECDFADATLAGARAERVAAQAEHSAAQTNWEQALAVTEALAKARADEAGRRAEGERRAAAVDEARARERVARSELALQHELAATRATGARQVELAEARLDEAVAAIARMQAEAALAVADHAQAVAGLARADADMKLRIEDRLRLDTAAARVAAAEAKVAETQQMCARARLHLAHTEVLAPMDGVVLERLAMPGTPLDGGEAGAPVISLYDPAHLRVRVDVAQGEIAKLVVGQRAEIHSETRAGRPYAGEVLRIVQRADIQKVTLQAHVRVLEPDELLRPEMLCQVRFFRSTESAGGAAAQPSLTSASAAGFVEFPSRLLGTDGTVWVVDGGGLAVRRRVEVDAAAGTARDGAAQAWVLARSGLNATDKLIDEGREGLAEGARVRITREE